MLSLVTRTYNHRFLVFKVHLPISWKSWRSKKTSCHSCGSRNPEE